MNPLGQRTEVAKTGSAFASNRSIAWGYDALGQVTKADSSITGFDRAYEFDGIGNRKEAADSLTLTGIPNYTANALNQYTAVGAVNPAYDDDGNATAYPVPAYLSANSTLAWDAENRLTSATVNGTTTTYLYDSGSRRIAQTTGSTTTVYIYDAWNPIAEYTGTTLAKTYTWGLDLSGSLQGAGGVGGLLAVFGGSTSHFPTFDGNGNVSEYLTSAGATVAHYEYDPFGRATVASGTRAADFAHRFSTKPIDSATGLLHFGYRWMDPETGRWPSKDPIEEKGGINLYEFLGNSSVDKVDLLGKASVQVTTTCCINFDKDNPDVAEIRAYLAALPQGCKIIEMEINGHGNHESININNRGVDLFLEKTTHADGSVSFKVKWDGYDFPSDVSPYLDKDSAIHLDGCHTACTSSVFEGLGSPNPIAKELSGLVQGRVSGSMGFGLGDSFGNNPTRAIGVRATYRNRVYIGGKFAK